MQMMQTVMQFTIWLKLLKNWQMDFDKQQFGVLKMNFYHSKETTDIQLCLCKFLEQRTGEMHWCTLNHI